MGWSELKRTEHRPDEERRRLQFGPAAVGPAETVAQMNDQLGTAVGNDGLRRRLFGIAPEGPDTLHETGQRMPDLELSVFHRFRYLNGRPEGAA